MGNKLQFKKNVYKMRKRPMYFKSARFTLSNIQNLTPLPVHLFPASRARYAYLQSPWPCSSHALFPSTQICAKARADLRFRHWASYHLVSSFRTHFRPTPLGNPTAALTLQVTRGHFTVLCRHSFFDKSNCNKVILYLHGIFMIFKVPS